LVLSSVQDLPPAGDRKAFLVAWIAELPAKKNGGPQRPLFVSGLIGEGGATVNIDYLAAEELK
jgi:hypothetical protein